jgi:hypothetical protein
VVIVCPQAGQAPTFCLDTESRQRNQGGDLKAKIRKVPLKRNELTVLQTAQTAFLFFTLHFPNFLTPFDQGQ